MSPPSLQIVLELEARPRFIANCRDEGDAERLADWLMTLPEYDELVDLLERWKREAV